MAPANQYPGIDPRVVACIRHHARRVCSRIPALEVEDIEQELMLRVHQRLPQYDPSRSSLRTFTDRIARSVIASLVEAIQAKKRGPGLEVLFSDWMISPENLVIEPCESSDAETHQSIGFCPEPYLNLRTDLWRAFDQLPAMLRTCFLALFDNSVADAARRTGVSRSTTYHRVADLRAHFEAAGLRAYLADPDTFDVFPVSEQ
ncbi:MAG: sigma-70 family RNA polymerase sigma factor [Rhodospirillales bacterium]|nr:sigma-70 family RNA polymerase sigma factor [Rhodospirillales bacterium]